MRLCPDCNEEIKLRNKGGVGWKASCVCPDYAAFVPKEPATIIVPSKHAEIFEQCRESADRFAPRQNKILVRDGSEIVAPDGWKTIQGPDEPFVYSRNINLGIKESTGDVLLCNDDVTFLKPGTVETLQGILAEHPEVGIISPLTIGDVGEYWQGHAEKTLHYTEVRLCFVCVLIRREVIDQIGLLDERYTGYGYDDVDYCLRAKNAGYKLAATGKCSVRHGHGEHRRSSSYNRVSQSIDELDKIAGQQFEAKWGHKNLT